MHQNVLRRRIEEPGHLTCTEHSDDRELLEQPLQGLEMPGSLDPVSTLP